MQLVTWQRCVGVGGNINSSTEHSCKLSGQVSKIKLYIQTPSLGHCAHVHTPLHVPHTFLSSQWVERPAGTKAKAGTEEISHVSVKIKTSNLFSKVWTLARRMLGSAVCSSAIRLFPCSPGVISNHVAKTSLHSSLLVWSQIVNAVGCLRVCLS